MTSLFIIQRMIIYRSIEMLETKMAKCLCDITFPNKHTNVGEITVALTCPIHGKLRS